MELYGSIGERCYQGSYRNSSRFTNESHRAGFESISIELWDAIWNNYNLAGRMKQHHAAGVHVIWRGLNINWLWFLTRKQVHYIDSGWAGACVYDDISFRLWRSSRKVKLEKFSHKLEGRRVRVHVINMRYRNDWEGFRANMFGVALLGLEQIHSVYF